MDCLCVRCENFLHLWVTTAPHNVLVRVKLVEKPSRAELLMLLASSYKKPAKICLQFMHWHSDAYVCELRAVYPPPPAPAPLRRRSFLSRACPATEVGPGAHLASASQEASRAFSRWMSQQKTKT